ncbi:hypothetical protein BHU72_06060 [Desulfuribacillus stibiiarsenatis]|uniref:Uncharacterized protein n=1 Tax=Desulfuribacillus stibiiarsenatis TaxID=1390249 RepID=A0A1E5L4T2_9FIRM|nr:hypothetical protein [Desulfuribacillus stibiiarsenatis]OEH85172.1 hypothetical protein BHU72_06060 [Desulfuribacillus stibiiarsenatis]
MNYVKKKELIQLLDRVSEIDKIVFETVNGEEYAASNEDILVEGLREPFQKLIPKTTWTKYDYAIKYGQLTLLGIQKDADGQSQLIIGIDEEETTFITTTEALFQLFERIHMGNYSSFLMESDENFDLLNYNFKYWFKGKLADTDVLLRTVIEKGQPIARCFASQRYQQIDNHILMYCTVWALDTLKFNFKLTSQKVMHSSMKLSFESDKIFDIDGIGKLSYGFSVINSESKSHSVELLPTCNIQNVDGTRVSIILDRTIKIRHLGNSIEPVIKKILELKHLPEHVERAIEVIISVKNEKINPFLAYKIQQSLIDIIGKKAFSTYIDKYTQVSSENTYSLLEFFGRLHEIPVQNEDKQILIESLYWSTLNSFSKK